MKGRTSSSRILELQPNEIFVFGSNLAGMHGGGAARLAYEKWGAIWGQGVGLQGQTYAIPTMQGGVATIKPYVDEFIRFAKEHPNMIFLVTEIGCGIAGFKVQEIAPLFRETIDVENIRLPERFWNILKTEEPIDVEKFVLLGALAGDIIGSVYEFNNTKDYCFPLFSSSSEITDDTILTIAIADALISGKRNYADRMRYWGQRYPNPKGAYGGSFNAWLHSRSPQPYNSWGNGSAMRVSSVGWAFNSLEETLEEARRSAEVTHNHSEGIKGVQSVAACIYLARTGKSKEEIKEYIINVFNYDLNRPYDEIHQYYSFDVSCQGSVPESIIAFLESKDFEDAIRLAISLGGDSDTIGCITGSIAEAYYYGIPESIATEVIKQLPNEMLDVIEKFSEYVRR